MPDRSRRLEVGRLAVHRACRVCRTLQGRLAEIGKLRKDDRSPVTVADFAAQAVVAHTLEEGLGAQTLVAEESAATMRAQMRAGETDLASEVVRATHVAWDGSEVDDVLDAIDLGNAEGAAPGGHGFWTLDPIDGTKGFLRGGQYAVCLAWIESGLPVIGLLGCPNLSSDFNRPFDDPDPHGTIYFAVAGEGLYEQSADEPNAPSTRVHRLERRDEEPLRLCESIDGGHTSHDVAERVMVRLGEMAEPCRLDGQGKYAVVARGQADIYLRMPRRERYVERIWDHAAGALVASESGCAVTDARGAALDFGCGTGMERNQGITVAMPDLHGRVLAAIETELTSAG